MKLRPPHPLPFILQNSHIVYILRTSLSMDLSRSEITAIGWPGKAFLAIERIGKSTGLQEVREIPFELVPPGHSTRGITPSPVQDRKLKINQLFERTL